MPGRDHWTTEEATAWYAGEPWLAGCNFIPSTAVNQLEMWQAETFDLETIERELGWAQDLGFNTMRVFLHDLLWQQDAPAFLDRIDRFLDIAAQRGIRTLLVLFDGVWYPRPRLGPQPAPRPHVHNSRWLQSPGAEILGDLGRHDALEPYVLGVIERFSDDERVLGWDLFNEPDNPNGGHPYEIEEKEACAIALLAKAFRWAREAGPSQPITAGVWRGRCDEHASELNRLMIDESDVLSFHSYQPPDEVAKRIDELERYGRPLLLTEYLSRAVGNTFEALLPMLKERKVPAFNWGFVAGKTQTQYPWDSWTTTYEQEPDPWFHDVLRPDGTPYHREETDLIRRLTTP